jgi:hypothetical protein
VLELRLQNGRHFHPRLGVGRGEVLRGLAVVQPFVPSDASDGTWRFDRRRAPATVVQLSSLGRCVEMLEEPHGVFDPLNPSDGMGGPAVSACRLPPALFQAEAMVRVRRDLMNMTVLQLKEELEARGAPKSPPLKSVLRGRLLALIITAAGAGAAERGEESARKRPRRD